MSKIVSVRVPDAIYEQASIQLRSLGATSSDLVNAAFEYVLKEHSLPAVPQRSKQKKRVLSEEKRQELASLFERCTLGIDLPPDTSYDKKTVRESRASKYEIAS